MYCWKFNKNFEFDCDFLSLTILEAKLLLFKSYEDLFIAEIKIHFPCDIAANLSLYLPAV